MMARTTILIAALLCLGIAQAQDKVVTKLYTVHDGYKVDANTLKGFRAWRANQEGLVGPSLLASMKTLTKEEFVKVVRDGRLDKGMQSFGTSPTVMENMDHLYAYLKGRADGAITRAKVEAIE
jgi:hypothetical protein